MGKEKLCMLLGIYIYCSYWLRHIDIFHHWFSRTSFAMLVGAVEDVVEKSIEPIKVYSEKELIREMKIASTLVIYRLNLILTTRIRYEEKFHLQTSSVLKAILIWSFEQLLCIMLLITCQVIIS